ncbi:MAG TPA: hypothetical protein VLJ58_04690, partial [Ramlibacter sp.]|nr:hypothetical protein [Ramlibacter sp.]
MSFDITSKMVVAMSAEGGDRVRNELANVAKGVDKVVHVSDLAQRAWSGLLGGLTAAAFANWIKGSVDAADATNEMAQKTGLAHKQVAGIELAYKQAGLGSEAMASSIGKLSKQMVDGNATFDTLGVKTRNLDGTMRSTKDVLYDTADAFSGIKDGAYKASLAQEIFGRSGTEMLPVLNGGAEGFREMAEMAEKLGLVISEDTALAADQFNDQVELLGMGLAGVGRQVAAQLLPTLTSLSSSFLESMTQGDALRKTADFLGTALRGVYTGGVLVAEVFNTVGKVLGAAAAQIAAILRGDISGWVSIAKEAVVDIKAGWTSTAESIARAWDTSGNAVVQGLAKVVKGQRDLIPTSKEGLALAKAQAAVWRDLEAELEKASDAGQKYGESIDARNSIMERELLLGRDLTEAEKAQIDLTEKLANGTLYLTRTDEAATRAKIELGEQLRLQKDWLKAAQQATLELAKAREAEYVGLVASTQAVQEQARAQELANLTTVSGIDYSEAMSVAKLREAATTQELNAIRVEERELNFVLGQQYRDNAEALRRLASAKEGASNLTRLRAEADELKGVFSGLGQVLEDALVNGGHQALDSIKKEFELAVIHMAVQGVLNNGYAAAAGALGMAGGSTGAGSWLGSANGAYGVGSNLAYAAGGLWGMTGMSTGASAASLTYANAVGAMGGDSLGALISANGGWSGVSAGAGAGASSSAASAIPIIGWIIAAVMASNAAYKGGNTLDMLDSSDRDLGVGKFESDKYDVLSSLGFSDRW